MHHLIINANEAAVQGVSLRLKKKGSIGSLATKRRPFEDFFKFMQASSASTVHHVVDTVKFKVLHGVVMTREYELDTPLVVGETELFL